MAERAVIFKSIALSTIVFMFASLNSFIFTSKIYIKSNIGGKLASQADVLDLILRSKEETHPLRNSLSKEDLEKDVIQQASLLRELIYEFIDKVLVYNQSVIIKDSRDFKE